MLSARLYILTGLAGILLAGLGWSGHRLYKAGYDKATLDHIKDAQLIADAVTAVERTTAKAISEIEVKHVTIRQNLEKELTRDVVYRDCVASPRVLELTNEAITGQAEPAPNSFLPAAIPVK